MGTSAAFVIDGTAKRVNYDGYPENMLPALNGRTLSELAEIVKCNDIRQLTVDEVSYYNTNNEAMPVANDTEKELAKDMLAINYWYEIVNGRWECTKVC